VLLSTPAALEQRIMPESVGRFIYFLGHPSEYIGLWTLDLTLATVLFSLVTLLVILRQLNLMERQTDILVRQDELLSRRARLFMYVEPSPTGQVAVLCRNDGTKTAKDFYWHLSVPVAVSVNNVRNALGSDVLHHTGMASQDGTECRHYNCLVSDPLYPTRITPLVRINTTDPKLLLWWSTVTEDGADPTPDGKMERMEREKPPSEAV
jgi:hypothetical protein